jgi:dCTP deaminase
MLSDAEIRSLVTKGKLIVSNYREEQLTPNGYDLTAGMIRVPGENGSDGNIPARSFFLVSTLERLDMPSGIAGQIWLKSSFCRKGIIGSFGLVDSGFRGELTLALYNAADTAITIFTGRSIAQITFIRMSSEPAQTYEQRSGNYQNQTGVTTEPARR